MGTTMAARSLPAMADHKFLRMMMVFLLYFSQGIPIGVFNVGIAGWLAANGATPAQIGTYATFAVLPWSLKFVNGFIMDRFTFLPMGRRRIWIVGSQFVMVLGFVFLALANPGPDDIMVLSIAAFAIVTATTFQDVAVDGMAVDIIHEEERARANGFMFGGQITGVAALAAFSGFALTAFGVQMTMIVVAIMILTILAGVTLFRERQGERMLPWTVGAPSVEATEAQITAWWTLLKQVFFAMFRRRVGLHVTGMMMVGAMGGFMLITLPLIATQLGGWSSGEYASMAGISGLVAGGLAIFLFGFVADWMGPLRFGLLLFALVVVAGSSFLFLQPYWSMDPIIMGAIMTADALGVGLTVILAATAMKMCNLAVAATQFTVLMALGNAGKAIATSLFPAIHGSFGYSGIIISIIICGATGFVALVFLRRTLSAEDGAATMPAMAPAE